MSDLDCSVVIVTWNALEVVRACLESVEAARAQSRYRFEVIVVDNGSTDGTQEALPERFRNIRLLNAGSNTGFAHAANLGIGCSVGRHILLMNNDIILQPGAVDKLIEAADRYTDGGMFAAHELGPEGQSHFYVWHPDHRPSWRELVSQEVVPPEIYQRFIQRVRRRTLASKASQDVVDCGRTSASCILVRRAALEDVGLLDERFFYLYEDYDWCYRFRRKRWRILLVPAAPVIHLVGSSSVSTTERRFLFATRGKLIWYRKYFQPGLLPVYRGLLFFGGIPRLVYHFWRLAQQRRLSVWPRLVSEWWNIVMRG